MGVFDTTLHAQPFRAASTTSSCSAIFRATRQVGYLAVGHSRGHDTSIGHFCTSVIDYHRDSTTITTAVADARQGRGIISHSRADDDTTDISPDPDGIEIQSCGARYPGHGAVPSDLVRSAQGAGDAPRRRSRTSPRRRTSRRTCGSIGFCIGWNPAPRPHHQAHRPGSATQLGLRAGRRRTETAHRALRGQGVALRFREGDGWPSGARRARHPVTLRDRGRQDDRPRRHQFRGRCARLTREEEPCRCSSAGPAVGARRLLTP